VPRDIFELFEDYVSLIFFIFAIFFLLLLLVRQLNITGNTKTSRSTTSVLQQAFASLSSARVPHEPAQASTHCLESPTITLAVSVMVRKR
jgi:hypothetical protein